MGLTTISRFSKYLNGVAINRNSMEKYTHLSMDGFCTGVFRITNDQDFRYAYGRAIQTGGYYYLCEMRTVIFRMFLDLDFELKPGTKMTEEQVNIILKVMQTTTSLFYPTTTTKKTFTMVVCDVKENSNLHIYIPGLNVNEEQAIVMAHSISAKLQDIVGDMGGILVHDWYKIVDASVYMKNGLRLVGSRKCKTCPKCKSKSKICVECGGVGKVDLGRVYRLCTVFTNGDYNEAEVKRYKGNLFSLLDDTTIRTMDENQKPTAGWRKYIGCPTLDCNRLKRPRATDNNVEPSKRWSLMMKQNAQSYDLSSYSEDRKGEAGQRSLITIIPKTTSIYKICEKTVRRFASVYQNIEIRDLKTTKKKHYYRVTVRGEGSNYCFNLETKREHKSNTVYFIIKPSGVVQKCWCRCNVTVNRKNGLCSQYTSNPKPLYTQESAVLFPMMKQSDVRFSYVPRSGKLQTHDDIDKVVNRLYSKAYVN